MKFFFGVVLNVLILATWVQAEPMLGVKAQSFGGAYRAVANSNDSVFYNPAGLIKTRKLEADVDYMLNADSMRHRMGASLVDAKTTDWGMGIAYSAGFSKKTDLATDHLVALSLGMPILSDSVALGASFNYLNNPALGPERHFFNIDLGLLLTSEVGLSFAVVLDHLLKPKGLEKAMGLSLGSAFELASVIPTAPVTLSFDWSMHNLTIAGDLSHSLAAGAEFIVMSLIPVRLGFRADQLDEGKFISIGSGVVTGTVSFDALYQQHLAISQYRNFGLALRMSI